MSDQFVFFNDMNIESMTNPPLVETYVVRGIRVYNVNVDVEYINGNYQWEQVNIPNGKFDYGGIVDTLISYKYPIDKMQAVINNYLLGPEDAYAIDEFNKMQAWRKEAKEIAKEALLYELP